MPAILVDPSVFTHGKCMWVQEFSFNNKNSNGRVMGKVVKELSPTKGKKGHRLAKRNPEVVHGDALQLISMKVTAELLTPNIAKNTGFP